VPDPDDINYTRYRYDYDHPTITKLENYLKSPDVLEYLGNILNKKLEFRLVKLWIDMKMLLGPHCEQPNGNLTAAMIYLTREQHDFLGTTICQDDEKILFQLPFRNNFGWLFEKSDLVMHAKITETPENFKRYSLMIFFN
jgi:hypothetical protein